MTRVLFNVTIFLNLRVDTCGRIHEIASTERYLELYLCWKDLRVYVFNQNGSLSLGEILYDGNLKGMKDDSTHFREILLSLLSLLIAALIDGHIECASVGRSRADHVPVHIRVWPDHALHESLAKTCR